MWTACIGNLKLCEAASNQMPLLQVKCSTKINVLSREYSMAAACLLGCLPVRLPVRSALCLFAALFRCVQRSFAIVDESMTVGLHSPKKKLFGGKIVWRQIVCTACMSQLPLVHSQLPLQSHG
jgi:hypothetical protein